MLYFDVYYFTKSPLRNALFSFLIALLTLMNTFQKSKTTQSDNTHSVFFADLETMLKNKPTVKVKPQKVPTRKVCTMQKTLSLLIPFSAKLRSLKIMSVLCNFWPWTKKVFQVEINRKTMNVEQLFG